LSIYFMWGGIPTPHGPCSYCYSPYHHVRDCPTIEQFSNYSYEYMNTLFSRPRNDSYSDSYNPAWSNQSNISWQVQAPENYAPQIYELYHQTYSQFNEQSYSPQYQATPQQQSQATPSPRLDFDFQDQMLKFMSKMDQALNSHSQSIARIEVQMVQMANTLNRMEAEELQSQRVANLDGHYMVDESTSYHEQAITTIKNGEVVETHLKERKEEQIEAP
jgi:hypothetical protein